MCGKISWQQAGKELAQRLFRVEAEGVLAPGEGFFPPPQLSRLLPQADEALALGLAREGRRLALERYDAAVVGGQLLDALDSIASLRRGERPVGG